MLIDTGVGSDAGPFAVQIRRVHIGTDVLSVNAGEFIQQPWQGAGRYRVGRSGLAALVTTFADHFGTTSV